MSALFEVWLHRLHLLAIMQKLFLGVIAVLAHRDIPRKAKVHILHLSAQRRQFRSWQDPTGPALWPTCASPSQMCSRSCRAAVRYGGSAHACPRRTALLCHVPALGAALSRRTGVRLAAWFMGGPAVRTAHASPRRRGCRRRERGGFSLPCSHSRASRPLWLPSSSDCAPTTCETSGRTDMRPSWWGPARLRFEELTVIDTTSTPLTWDRLLSRRETFSCASYVLNVLSSVVESVKLPVAGLDV